MKSKNTTSNIYFDDNFEEYQNKCKYTVALCGNPNVGKSTIFNSLTGMHQHTGNWPGKTVSNARGITSYNNQNYLFIDIPGTYSLQSNSEEEEIARDYICFGKSDVICVVVDATCLERNLNLVYQTMEITNKIVLCVNLLDEAKRKGISLDIELLEKKLGIPVVGTIAHKKKTLNNLMQKLTDVCNSVITPTPHIPLYPPEIEKIINNLSNHLNTIIRDNNKYMSRWLSLKLLDNDDKIIQSIDSNMFNNRLKEQKSIHRLISNYKNQLISMGFENDKFKDCIVSTILKSCEQVCNQVVSYRTSFYCSNDKKIDKILTSKIFGPPIMLLFMALIFWLTIVGSNFPSKLLGMLFGYIKTFFVSFLKYLHFPSWGIGLIADGIYSTLTWIISVMLPPMAIFFPLFTLLEDLGYLPRIAFNLDKYFRKACTSRKTSSYNVYADLAVTLVVLQEPELLIHLVKN